MAINKSLLSVFFLLSLFLLSTTLSLAEEKRRGNRDNTSDRRERERYLSNRREEWRGEGSEEDEQEDNNPYIFNKQRLSTYFYNQQARERVLDRLGKKSELLRGFRNYNLAFIETKPNSFAIPRHLEADMIFFVVEGKGAITLMNHDRRETHNLEIGDIFVLPSGTHFYFFNRDPNKNFRFAKLLRSVTDNDYIQPFYSAGGTKQKSFYQVFSREIIEAALNTPGEKLERLFTQQDQEPILRVSEEQIRSLSQQSSFEGEPFNLFERGPSQGNNHGQLYEASTHDQLQELAIAISFANITRGSIFGPYYNTRATEIGVVLKGRGHVQIVCPRLSGQKGVQYYERVSADVSEGDMFVIPAGHPVLFVASQDGNDRNENLELMCFEINANNNERFPLAGEGNVMLKIDEEALELSFNQEVRLVKEVFGSQKGTLFFPGPSQRREEGQRHDSVSKADIERKESGKEMVESIVKAVLF